MDSKTLGQSQIIYLKNYFPLILMFFVKSKWYVLNILIQVKLYLMKDFEISEFLNCSYLRWLLEICHYHCWNLVDSMENFEAWHVYLLFYELNHMISSLGSDLGGGVILLHLCVYKNVHYKSDDLHQDWPPTILQMHSQLRTLKGTSALQCPCISFTDTGSFLEWIFFNNFRTLS